MKKTYLFILPLLSILFLLQPSFVLATNIDTAPTEGISASSSTSSMVNSNKNQVYESTSDSAYSDEVIRKVTTDEVSNRIVNKIYDVIAVLQKIARPFSIVMFILSAFFALCGIFSHGGFVMKGIWGMIIAVAVYTVIIAAPEIVLYLSSWLMN